MHTTTTHSVVLGYPWMSAHIEVGWLSASLEESFSSAFLISSFRILDKVPSLSGHQSSVK
jgi:hypothetical protein